MKISQFLGLLATAVAFAQPLTHSALRIHEQNAPAAPKSSPPSAASTASPIRFTFQPIDFRLDSSETPERHAPETMAGGVAILDYNNDGKPDVFFTNGADIKTLR